EEIVQTKEELSEWQIKNIHELVLKGMADANAGVYRRVQVFITGAQHIPPPYEGIQDEMKQMISWYHEEGIFLHPVERSAKLHTIFVSVHPFIDGNGRTARLLLNLELMKDGYPPVIIKVEDRLAYYEALD